MQSSLNFSDVYVFNRVASTLSLTKASRQIGISKSAVSKQLRRLEADLGVLLVNRTTRKVSLTEAGRLFHDNTTDVETSIARAADLVRGADMSPLGTVSVTMPVSLGAALMPAITEEFQPRWPELKLNFLFSDRFEDLTVGGIDLAIRISRKLADSSLVSRRIGTTRRVLAGSPGYFREHGFPDSPADLANHRLIGLGSRVGNTERWTLSFRGRKSTITASLGLAANSYQALIQAATLHAGIMSVPELLIREELKARQLEVVPSMECPESYGIYAVYPHRNAAAKVRVLMTFIQEKLIDEDFGNDQTSVAPEPGPDFGDPFDNVLIRSG